MDTMLYIRLASWFMVIRFSSCNKQIRSTECHPIPLDDVKLSLDASEFAYRSEVNIGDKLGSSHYTVVNVTNPSLHQQPLRAVVATYNNVTLIFFRGTDGVRQLFHQFKSTFEPSSRIWVKHYEFRVLEYFWDALMLISPESLVPGGIRPGRKYIVTGHSLGGALASLFSLHMRLCNAGLWHNPYTSLITFGSPRVGDPRYAHLHDQVISPNRKLRISYSHDVIESLPVRGNNSYLHHSRKVWVWRKYIKPNNFTDIIPKWKTQVTFCQRGDDPRNCRPTLPNYSFPDHRLVKYKRIARCIEWFRDVNGNKYKKFEDAQCR